MPAAHVRNHTAGTANTSGTTVSATLAANVVSDRLLLAWVFFYNDTTTTPTVTGISKPGGESASWARVAKHDSWSNTSGWGLRGELWAIKTTTTWSSGSSVTATTTSSSNVYRIIQLGEFSGANAALRGTAGSFAGNTSAPSASTSDPLAGDLVVGCASFDGNSAASADTDTVNGSWSAAYTAFNGISGIVQHKVVTASGTQTYNPTGTAPSGAVVAAFVTNTAPNAPTITAPASGATIDRTSTQRFDWDFSDPDAGDSQSKYDLRYRIVGAGTWTEVTGTTPNTFHDFAAGTFAAGDYEWQVRTYDAQGAVGPYSGSSFFTAATAPATPTITAPINGATVSQSETTEWSAPDQDAYQHRRVADNAGAPDTATVYEDSGEVVSTTARSRAVTFATNNRYEHVQVRIKDNGLWSTWASVRVQVSWTPPPTPLVSLLADDDAAALIVTITNPAPGAGEPATSYNDVYVDDGDGEFRAATQVTANTAWTYWTPRARRDYAGNVRAVAVGDNGTTASSA